MKFKQRFTVLCVCTACLLHFECVSLLLLILLAKIVIEMFSHLKCWLPFEKLLQCNGRSWDRSWATEYWSPTLWVNGVKSVWQICRMVQHFSIDLSSSTTTDKQTFHGNHDQHFLPLAHKFLSNLISYEDFVVTGQTNKEIRSICHCFALVSWNCLFLSISPVSSSCVCLLGWMCFFSANVKVFVFVFVSSFYLSGSPTHCCMYSLQQTAKNIFTTESRKYIERSDS